MLPVLVFGACSVKTNPSAHTAIQKSNPARRPVTSEIYDLAVQSQKDGKILYSAAIPCLSPRRSSGWDTGGDPAGGGTALRNGILKANQIFLEGACLQYA